MRSAFFFVASHPPIWGRRRSTHLEKGSKYMNNMSRKNFWFQVLINTQVVVSWNMSRFIESYKALHVNLSSLIHTRAAKSHRVKTIRVIKGVKRKVGFIGAYYHFRILFISICMYIIIMSDCLFVHSFYNYLNRPQMLLCGETLELSYIYIYIIFAWMDG